jgi:phosphocarrier protein HPr
LTILQPKDNDQFSSGGKVPVQEATVTIKNRTGLHARPAALFVQQANKFESKLRVSKAGSNEANGKSILEVLSLGISCGAVITIRAEGEDAEEAVPGILALLDSFGELE